MACEEKDTPDIIERFFIERLNFKEPPANQKNIMKFDTLLRRAHHKLRSKNRSEPEPVTTVVEADKDEDDKEASDGLYTDDEECSSLESELDEEQRKFYAFL